MNLQLRCPCGVHLEAPEEQFVERVQQHLAEAHPGRTYTEEQIRFLATPA